MGRWIRLAIVLGMGLIVTACARIIPGLTEATPTETERPPAQTSPAAATMQPTQSTTPSPTPAGAWIRADPNTGVPGQVIHIEGFFPGGLAQTDLAGQDYLTHADLCWDGCKNGMMESVDVTWSRTEAGRFSLPFTVPPIPWLAADGLHLMQAGDYPLDLIHLEPGKADCPEPDNCVVTPVASTTFQLTQAAPHPPCNGQTCGSLNLTPASASPGERVEVTGWAPLLELVGTPFGYGLVLMPTQGAPNNQDLISFPVEQALDGSIHSSFLMPQTQNNGQPITPGSYLLALRAENVAKSKDSPPMLVNATTIQFKAAREWTQIKRPVPIWISPSTDLGGINLAVDALHPARMAYCGGGKIMVSDNAGQAWSAIPDDAASKLSPDSKVTLGDPPLACISVTLDSTHPDSFYAVFAAVSKEYGAPPVYFVACFTTDRGKTWQLVPLPSIWTNQQMIMGNFNGFWTNGAVVQALYFGERNSPDQSAPLLVKQTSDGGATWSEASLACPASGPCLRWGAAPFMGGGMGAVMPQGVLTSADGGQTWQDPDQSVELRMDGPHELAALTDTQAVLISGIETFPLRYTADAGKTWHALALPPLPVTNPGWPLGYSGLQMLPDGSLMAMRSDTGQWLRLAPSAQDWCQTGLASPDKASMLLTITGDRVWWLAPMDQLLQSAPVSVLRCQN